MSSDLEKSRLVVANEAKFDMLAATSELGDHAKQYRAISRDFSCMCPNSLIRTYISQLRSVADTVTGRMS